MLTDFFYKYFVEPIKLGYGYNLVNTLAYSILFVALAYLLYAFLKKVKVKFDARFVLGIVPWIVFGIFLRILEDMSIIKSKLFVTPNIWLVFLVVITGGLVAAKLVEKRFKVPYYKIMFVSGVVLSAPLVGFFSFKNLLGLWYTILFFVPWVILLKYVRWSTENKAVTLLHMFDATTTAVSLQFFRYFEQHVLPRTIIDVTGTPFSFVFVKLVVVVFVLQMLDKYSDDKEFVLYLKIVIGILGFITGLRDLLRLVLLT